MRRPQPTDPTVSVLMPAYNAAGTIDTAVKSILNQDFSELELLIIDDGSTDETGDHISAWQQEDHRVISLHQSHRGIVKALNHGLRCARGRYIARMDADDISLPSRISSQSSFLDRYPVIGVVSGKAEFMGQNKHNKGYARYVDWVNGLTSENDISLRRFVESPVPHPSVMFRRWIVTSLGGYRDGDFPEDYELWLRWLDAGIRFAKLNQPVIRWRDHPERLSRVHSRYEKVAFHRIKSDYLLRWLQCYNPHHPEVIVWGSNRTNRKRAELLEKRGIEIKAYVDVNPDKIGQKIHERPVWSPDQLPPPDQCFLLCYVASPGAKEEIGRFLRTRKYREGVEFLYAS